jgi:hypothetical protein
MNAHQKYMEDNEQEAHFNPVSKAHPRESVYYLQRRLRIKKIGYSSRKQIVFVTSDQTDDVHVQKLLKDYKFTVQTIIK